jgi:hypothetical protein
MTIEGVTVSLAAELRHAAQQAADATGTAFSAVIADAALHDLVRGRTIDEFARWVRSRGWRITEQEMQVMSNEMGLPPELRA